MQVIKVIVSSMPDVCLVECPINFINRRNHECGKMRTVLSISGQRHSFQTPDERCLLEVDQCENS